MLIWRPRLSVVYIQVLFIASGLSLGKASLDVAFIVDQEVHTASHDTVNKPAGTDVILGCVYTDLVTSISLYRIDDNQQLVPLPTTSGTFHHFRFTEFLSYTERNTQGCRTYKCVGVVSGGPAEVLLTIDFGGCPTASTNPTSSTSSTSTSSSTSSGTASGPTSGPTTPPGSDSSNNSKKFTGLKPLIFTVASVILLGTLAIVAIITCWIRARRSFNSRQIRPNNTPQDYLDYINDNEFTPLTTSEFLASLQERPPTYNQSEEMVQSGAEAGTTGSTNQTPQQPAASSSGGEATESRPSAPPPSREGSGSQAERGRGRPRRVRRDRSQNTTASEGAGSEGADPSNQQSTSNTGGEGGGGSSDQLSQGPAGEQEQHASPHTDASGDVDRTDVAILVDLEPLVEGLSQLGNPFTPTQEQIEEIEAHVRTLESLAPPPPSSDHGSPSPHLSAGGTGSPEDNSTNLHVNLPPPPSPPSRL